MRGLDMTKRIVEIASAAALVLCMGAASAAEPPAPNNDAGISAPRDQGTVSAPAKEPAEAFTGVGQTLIDAAITTSVRSKLISNPSTSGRNIKVTTEDGVVVLSGRVGSATEKSVALEIASNTKGVKDVRNGLMIEGGS